MVLERDAQSLQGVTDPIGASAVAPSQSAAPWKVAAIVCIAVMFLFSLVGLSAISTNDSGMTPQASLSLAGVAYYLEIDCPLMAVGSALSFLCCLGSCGLLLAAVLGKARQKTALAIVAFLLPVLGSFLFGMSQLATYVGSRIYVGSGYYTDAEFIFSTFIDFGLCLVFYGGAAIALFLARKGKRSALIAAGACSALAFAFMLLGIAPFGFSNGYGDTYWSVSGVLFYVGLCLGSACLLVVGQEALPLGDNDRTNPSEQPMTDNAAVIREIKAAHELVEQGALTQEEFEERKRLLLR